LPDDAHDEPHGLRSREDRTMSSLTELQELVHKKYGLAPDVLDPDKPMVELGLDSLAIAEFLFEVEDHFAIRLTDDDPDVDTLRKLSVLVDQSIAAKETATTPAA
jgi:acyl carrier protein